MVLAKQDLQVNSVMGFDIIINESTAVINHPCHQNACFFVFNETIIINITLCI